MSSSLNEVSNELSLFRNPDYRKARYNPIRRLFRAPMNFVEFNILSMITKDWRKAKGYRHGIVTMATALGFTWTVAYYCLYKGNNWTDVRNFFKTFFEFWIKTDLFDFRKEDGRPSLANLGFFLDQKSGHTHLRITTKTKMILPALISNNLAWPKSNHQLLSDIHKITTFWTKINRLW